MKHVELVLRTRPRAAGPSRVAADVDGPDAIVQRAKVCAVVSIPRLGWNDAWGNLIDALGHLRIPLRRATGAYFDHCMERVLEECIAAGTDWALCLDYDTIAHPMHVQKILGLAAAYPDADAICAMQAKRCADEVLAKRDAGQPRPDEFLPDLMPVDAGHFGFTVLKLDKLAKVPKPWFEHAPAPDGSWNEGRVDSDMNFWRKWKAAGNTLRLANHVRVGHLQLVVTWPMPDGTIAHQYVNELNKNGIPAEAFE